MDRKQTQTSIQQTQTRFIGMSVPIDFHEQLRAVAEREGMSASQLYRKALVEYVNKAAKK